MNKITEELLKRVSDYTGECKGAYNIREDVGFVGRQSSEHSKLQSNPDGLGM